MKIAFFGDVVGRDARDKLILEIPRLRATYSFDVIVVNAENAAHGFGITAQICQDFYKAGVDCITTGNHIWDQREIIAYINSDQKLLRPANYPEGTPGKGHYVVQTALGKKILVINAMARLYMDALDDPFAVVNKILDQYPMGQGRAVDAVLVDFHGEAASEKMAMGHYCDGRVSLVVGTHTHVPTADTQIFPKGTGYMTDAGMCGCFISVIGNDTHIAVNRFTRKVPGEKLRPAEGPITLCGVYIETDDKTGLCKQIVPLRIGGVLSQSLPVVASEKSL